MIDGFRSGFTGHAESSLWIGYLLLAAANGILLVVAWLLIKNGYKIKS